MKNKIKYNCVFGGGGIRGMCYIGALRALNELDIEICSIAGASVGAVFAALYTVGYNLDEIKQLFLDFNFNMFRDLNLGFFNNDISLSKGEIFLEWLREKIGKKVLGEKYSKNSKILFKDIEKDLHILTIDLNTNTPFIFSKSMTPEEEIALAVRASAGLPGLMKPVNYNEAMLVDGDLIKSWPAWKIYPEFNTSKERLLEFRLEGSRDGSDIKNPMDYVNSVINTIWYFSTENVYNTYEKKDKYDFVVIDTKDVILFDFTIDKSLKEHLIERGYKVTKEYFESTIIKKKQILSEIYCNLYEKHNILNKFLIQNKPKDALNVINEILSDMKEKTEYIDDYIYEIIKELKENLLNNIKKYFFKEKIAEEKIIKEQNEFILKILNSKIEELRDYNIESNKI